LADIASGHNETSGRRARRRQGLGDGRPLTIALAGNANVGKSVIFNQLTGSDQIIGNWPGKTVEKAKGTLHFNGYQADIIDLPGIYSLSTFSLEEIVSREFIAEEKPDLIINVIGAPVLERNLFFTLQLMEMNVPVIVCLNQMDIAENQGLEIDARKLEKILGVPVVPTIASRGKGVKELVEKAFEVAGPPRHRGKDFLSYGETGIRHTTRYSTEVEDRIESLTHLIDAAQVQLPYAARWVAIKLLEGDAKVNELFAEKAKNVLDEAETLAGQIENIFQQPRYTVLASERYGLAGEIARSVITRQAVKPPFSERLDRLATGKVTGYALAFVVVAGLLVWTFTIGNVLSALLTHAFSFFQRVDPQVSGTLWSIVWNGVFGGLLAGVTLVIPYVIPFYLMLAVLEDSGVLTRVAFMLDSVMHQMGLHGKAIIPIILGYGCNVPAIYATRIMGTRRERLLTAFAVTFSPCAARTIIIFGLVAAYLGVPWALGLYAVDIVLMFAVTRLAVKSVPGESTGLIMEMHSFKVPSIPIIAKQTWARTKSLIYMVFPIYMVGTALVQGAYALGALQPIDRALSFLTVGWLGLPAIAGALLIFGAARKELILLMAVAIFGADLAASFTPVQLLVLALVGMIYPCFATIGVLTREFGWKAAWAIIGANLAVAILVGGVAAKVLPLFL
jgi:ferrous iron transport protein B